MADGLKAHTHQERERIIEALVPLIQRHLGRELVALAETGSVARNTDGAYSDIELIGFVRKRPDDDRMGAKFIHDGMLIDLWFVTRDEYLFIHKRKVRPEWPYAASSTLIPLLNEPFIRALKEVPWNAAPDACLATLENFWPLVQESVGKLLNAVARDDTAAVPYLYWNVAEKLCVALSFLNVRPFSTRAAVFTEARAFPVLPASFDALIDPPGIHGDRAELGRRAVTAFEEVERLLYARGLTLYAQSLEGFVKPLTFGDTVRRRLWANRMFRKVAYTRDKLRLKLRQSFG